MAEGVRKRGKTWSYYFDAAKIDGKRNKIELAIDTKGTPTSIKAYDGSTVSGDTIELQCEVTQKAETDGKTRHYLTNIAYIAEAYDKDGNKVEQDRKNKESKPELAPTQTTSQLNNTTANAYKGKDTNPSIYNDTNNTTYYAGQEDDDDFETLVVLPKSFDLALRKFITSISTDGNFKDATTKTYNRAPQVNTENLKTGKATTAIYNHSKEPIYLNIGNYVLYTIRAYNEGQIDGYAQ